MPWMASMHSMLISLTLSYFNKTWGVKTGKHLLHTCSTWHLNVNDMTCECMHNPNLHILPFSLLICTDPLLRNAFLSLFSVLSVQCRRKFVVT